MSRPPTEVGWQTKFMYLFERISEPIYFGPRGHGDNRVLYVTPTDRLPPNVAKAVVELRKGLPADKIRNINVSYSSVPYDLAHVKVIPRDAIFSPFFKSHLDAADALIKIFSQQTSLDDFFSAACLCRDEVNSHLWIYAVARSIILRPDMKSFRLPALWEITPDRFLNGNVLREARNQARLPELNRAIVVADRSFSGIDLNPENKVVYFREDLALNTAHWIWHIVYAGNAPPGQRDRKGELFFKMHHDMVARYDTERLANGLARTVAIDIPRDILEEGYFPKLTLENSALNWGTRQPNTTFKNVNRAMDPNNRGIIIEMVQMETWYQRLTEAIDQGIAITPTSQTISLNNEKGIDILGAMVESSILSPNAAFYGSLHNLGHSSVGMMVDPDFRFKENVGVMGATETAVRDPAFFRWHKTIDNLFLRHKATLPPYQPENLVWTGVTVNSVTVTTEDRTPNTLVTYWEQRDVDLSRGLDFGRGSFNNLGPILARFTHLQHEDFSYRMEVTNATGRPQVGTVRVFMAPSLDEHQLRLTLAQQMPLFFEMDKFTVSLKPGSNLFERKSVDSSITIPWEQSFEHFERADAVLNAEQTICGCGWPHHLLVPKGKADGLPCDVVVVISNWEQDRVRRKNPIDAEAQVCKPSIGFCGILNELFPDTKPMGYPFDRVARLDANGQVLDYLEDWLIPNSNMKGTQVTVIHREVTLVAEGSATDQPLVVQGAKNTPRSKYDTAKKAGDIVGLPALTRDSRSYQQVSPLSGANNGDWVDLGTAKYYHQTPHVTRIPRETYSSPDSTHSYAEHGTTHFDLY